MASGADDDHSRRRLAREAARAAILRRRAFFISSVTALVSCTPRSPASGPGAGAPVVPVETTGPSLPDPSGTASRGEGTPQSKLPSLEIPPNLNEVARRQFEHLVGSVQSFHERFDEVKATLPECAITETRCEASWEKLARQLVELEEMIPEAPVCPGTSADAKLYDQRLADHLAYIDSRKKAFHERLMDRIRPAGDAGKQRWTRYMENARAALPQVCLNYSCTDW